MLAFGNKEFRNLQEQVLENMKNIDDLKQAGVVLDEFGIKVVGQIASAENLPDPDDYEFGDAFAVGTQAPYTLYICTRTNSQDEGAYWLNVGVFPAPGPQGPQGETGPQGEKGEQGERGLPGLNGANGAQGEQGPQGEKGDTGEQGPQGEKGDPGTSYVILGNVDGAVNLPNPELVSPANGAYMVGTEAPYDLYMVMGQTGSKQWFNAGAVTVGPRGPAGADGQNGTDGTNGTDGITPHIDSTTGNWFIGSEDTYVHAQGPQGETGATGPEGPVGSFEIKGVVANASLLPTASTQTSGTAYLVGTESPYDLYVIVDGAWFNAGGTSSTITLSTDQVSGAATLGSITVDGDTWNIPQGGSGGSTVIGTANINPNYWNNISIDGTSKKVSVVTGTYSNNLWQDITIDGTQKAIPQVSGTVEDNVWKSLTINNETHSLPNADNRTIVVEQPQATRGLLRATSTAPVLKTAVGGYTEKTEVSDDDFDADLANIGGICWYDQTNSAYSSESAYGNYEQLGQFWADLQNGQLAHITFTFYNTTTEQEETVIVEGTYVSAQQWFAFQDPIQSVTSEGQLTLMEFDPGQYGFVVTMNLYDNNDAIINIYIDTYEISETVHPIDSKFIPVDGTTVTLNQQGQLQAAGGSSVSGINDGTNWTSITIDGVQKAIPSGGSSVSGTSTDYVNWANITIDGTTRAIPAPLRYSSASGSAITVLIPGEGIGAELDLNGRLTLTATNSSVEIDEQTIIENQSGKIETAIGGYTTTEGGASTKVFIDNATNIGYKSVTEPTFSYSGLCAALKNALGIQDLFQNQFTTSSNYTCIVKNNGTEILRLENINVAYNNNGTVVDGDNTAILIGASSGANRVSFNNVSTDVVRIKVYATSSAYTFATTDVVTLYFEGPDPDSGATVYHPIDGHFIGIDSSTMGYDDVNNQIYAKSQIPSAPTGDGNYVLKCQVVNGSAVYQWVLEA